jgi:outer membrane protein insertion porin family
MMKSCNRILVLILTVFALTPIPALCMVQEDDAEADSPSTASQRRVSAIHISGNTYTPTDAILNYVTYRVGELFQPQKARETILKLYRSLGRFHNITVKGKHVGDDEIEIYIIIEEKHPLKDIVIEGNSGVKRSEFEEKIKLDIPAIDEEDLQPIALQMKKIYLDKGYHETEIATELSLDNEGLATAKFIVKEGKKSLIKQINFVGNNIIPSKKLRSVIFSREDWVLGFMDQSGTYNPERIEADKHMIEQFYQNNGFLQAKVTNLVVEQIPDTPNINLLFEIEEGNQYFIDEVTAPGNDELSEAFLLANIPIRPGQPYSRERIGNTIKVLENIWGNYGHIFAHIEPSIQPDEDKKTVSLSFISDVGSKVTLNRINIKGNKKTRDKIIRRRIALEEGELLTKAIMNNSRNNVESLGFFDQRDGVNWKLRRLSDDLADLDLIVKEGKTGNFTFELGFGGSAESMASAAAGVTVKVGLADRNLFGSGINLNIDGSWAKDEQTVNFHIGQPWLFDKPISGALDVYHRRPTYDSLRNVNGAINQRLTGGALTAGLITLFRSPFLSGTQILGSVGVDSIRYQQPPKASFIGGPPGANIELQCILDREFSPGEFFWIAQSFEQDTRNHPIHITRGHKWQFFNKFALPSFESDISFYKVTLDAHWYTPVIEEYNLVLHLHGFAGFATQFKNRNIPFGELFHVGGPKSVRGFLFGQIGPKFLGDSIGATRALFWNAELIFPIMPDMTMKGLLFYDGGAGFNTPYSECVKTPGYLTNNNFDYRHAVGVGLRLLSPMPIAVDWGFKLDPRRDKRNPENDESPYEVHFGMTYDW